MGFSIGHNDDTPPKICINDWNFIILSELVIGFFVFNDINPFNIIALSHSIL